MRIVILDNGVVVNVTMLAADAADWQPEMGDGWREHATAEIGWLVDDDDALVPPPPDPAPVPTQAELIAYAANRRWQAEQAGAIWNGWPIHTDDRSQGKYLSELQAIALNARVDGDPWKFADGVFRPVSNADFPALVIKAREHVRTAFGIEGAVQAQIAAGTFTTRQQIADAFSSL